MHDVMAEDRPGTVSFSRAIYEWGPCRLRRSKALRPHFRVGLSTSAHERPEVENPDASLGIMILAYMGSVLYVQADTLEPHSCGSDKIALFPSRYVLGPASGGICSL